jgi:type I restriction enzyme S subunit
MDKQWPVVPLGELVDRIIGGGTPSRSDSKFWAGSIPWASVKDLGSRRLESTQESITQAGLDESASNLIPPNTVVMATRMNVGAVALTTRPTAINQDLKALFIKSNIDPEFFLYALQQKKPDLVSWSTGTTVKGLRLEALYSLQLPAPSLPEQRKIATILSSIDDTIEKTQAVIAQMEVVRKSLLGELLTRGLPGRHVEFKYSGLRNTIPVSWQERRLGELVTQVRMPVSVKPTDEYREIGVRSHGKGVFHKEPTTGAALGSKRVFWVEPSCIVVNVVFAWEGAVSTTSELDRGFIASHRFPMFRPRTGVDLYFLRYVLQSKRGVEFLKSVSPGGAGRNKTLNLSSFLACPVPVPSLEEQRAISGLISQAETTLVYHRELLGQLLKVKDALLDSLLSGRIRVAEPAQEAS